MALGNDIERANQLQTIILDRGLFLVRYTTAEDQARPPMVKVSADPTSDQDVSFILYPDESEPVLWQPDTCLVVRATASAKLAVQVVPTQEGGSTAATVRIEPLNQGKAAAPPHGDKPEYRTSNSSGAFRLLGHLTGRGDVLADADEWLAGPAAPSRIEGISLAWPNKPSDLKIRYAVKTARPQPISGQAVELGSFAGTRGKAMPIVGLMFEISGAAAERYQLSIETIFLGSPSTRTTGSRVVVYGPTGREPLVGLRVKLAAIASQAKPSTSQINPSKRKPRPSNSAVRVFRSRQKSKRRATG